MDSESKVELLNKITNLRLVHLLLGSLTKECQVDQERHLDVALDLIAEKRKKACLTCRLSALFIRAVLTLGAFAFGTTEDAVLSGLNDSIFRRAMSSIVTGLARFGIRKPFTPGAPLQVVWNVTRACNLKCKHCYENAGRRGSDELTTKQALKAIDIMSKAGVVFLAFSGGEPTIRPDILKLISRAAEKGMYIAVATNGTTFANRARVKEFKDAGMKFVQVSLDGIDAETHDTFRGIPGTFEKTIAGIKNCVAEGLFVEVSTTVTRYNFSQIRKMIALCEDLKVNWLMFYNLVPVGRGVELIDVDLTPIERERMLQILWERASSEKKSTLEVLTTAPQLGRIAFTANAQTEPNDVVVAPTHFSNPRLPAQMKSLTEFIGGCGAGRFYVALEPNGDIYPCVFFPHIDSMRVGNILRDDFEDVWINSRLLRRLRNKDILKDECGSCENRYVCGGCRARALSYFGDELAPDPGCINNMKHWNELVRSCEPDLELMLHILNPLPNADSSLHR